MTVAECIDDDNPLNRIIVDAANAWALTVDDVKKKCRESKFIPARQLAMAVAYTTLKERMTMVDMAVAFGLKPEGRGSIVLAHQVVTANRWVIIAHIQNKIMTPEQHIEFLGSMPEPSPPEPVSFDSILKAVRTEQKREFLDASLESDLADMGIETLAEAFKRAWYECATVLEEFIEAAQADSAFYLVSLQAQERGWVFQEPYVRALEMIVCRKRSPNAEQIKFWMAEATEQQRFEAYHDALAIIEAAKLL